MKHRKAFGANASGVHCWCYCIASVAEPKCQRMPVGEALRQLRPPISSLAELTQGSPRQPGDDPRLLAAEGCEVAPRQWVDHGPRQVPHGIWMPHVGPEAAARGTGLGAKSMSTLESSKQKQPKPSKQPQNHPKSSKKSMKRPRKRADPPLFPWHLELSTGRRSDELDGVDAVAVAHEVLHEGAICGVEDRHRATEEGLGRSGNRPVTLPY